MITKHGSNFWAQGKLFIGEDSVPVTIIGTYPNQTSGRVNCKVTLEWRFQEKIRTVYLFYYQIVWLTGRTERGRDIWIPHFQIHGSIYHSSHPRNDPLEEEGLSTLEGSSEFFFEGHFDEFNATKGRLSCYVNISPTLLLFQSSQDREKKFLTSQKSTKYKGIMWQTPLGQATLINTYEYVYDKNNVNPTLSQIQKCQIRIDVRKHRIISMRNLMEDLIRDLDEPLLIISFLSRSLVEWHAIEATFVPKDPYHDNSERYHEALAYRSVPKYYKEPVSRQEIYMTALPPSIPDAMEECNLEYDLPVDQDVLRDGMFQRILENYKQSPLKDTIRQTIEYLLIAHGGGKFETHLVIIYNALECLVNGLSKYHKMDTILSKNQFKKISNKLREEFTKEVGEDITENIMMKIGELQRPAIRHRLIKLLELYQLSNITLDGKDCLSKIQEIFHARNKYIHQGRIDIGKQYGHFITIREIIEIFLLKILVPEIEINFKKYRYVDDSLGHRTRIILVPYRGSLPFSL